MARAALKVWVAVVQVQDDSCSRARARAHPSKQEPLILPDSDRTVPIITPQSLYNPPTKPPFKLVFCQRWDTESVIALPPHNPPTMEA